MVGAQDLLSLFIMLITKANQGFWSLAGDETLIIQEYCDIKFRVYKTCTDAVTYTEYCVENGKNLFSSEFYNRDFNNTIILSNPFDSNFSHYNVKPMVEALTSRCKFNLIALDNTLHTNAEMFLDYPLTMLQVYKDCLRYASALNEAMRLGLFSAKHVTALGFSLGAQISGHVCRLLEEKCGHLFAIDAAGPFYAPKQIPLVQNYPHLQLVSRSDACDVIFVECNRWMLGTGFRTAHKNIVVNNGLFQSYCFPGDLRCSHEFCNKLVINAILKPGTCVASSAMKILGSFSSKTKEREKFTITLPLNEGTGSCDSAENKVFYITTDHEPECLGEPGAHGTGVFNSIRHAFRIF